MCQQPGASAGCAKKVCRAQYHYKCGLEDGAQFMFNGSFETFCSKHRKFQDLSLLDVEVVQCPICLDDITYADHKNIVKTPCCKNVYCHKACIQVGFIYLITDFSFWTPGLP